MLGNLSLSVAIVEQNLLQQRPWRFDAQGQAAVQSALREVLAALHSPAPTNAGVEQAREALKASFHEGYRCGFVDALDPQGQRPEEDVWAKCDPVYPNEAWANSTTLDKHLSSLPQPVTGSGEEGRGGSSRSEPCADAQERSPTRPSSDPVLAQAREALRNGLAYELYHQLEHMGYFLSSLEADQLADCALAALPPQPVNGSAAEGRAPTSSNAEGGR
ncbi:hypothetical protein [Phenylobacterium deserti]|uniref:Uncharacterized protein n=1 Tax=Phenylobacterium deserti TaxID=1914756 RepID=A0A328AFA7_9CAUL|nr:hypothetical protein [Phenylobacterium deserti]RAK52094.1 hypothetical protein DJ018_13140 [Phenylobacterium deserti]